MSTDSTHRLGKRKPYFLLYEPRTYRTQHRIAVLRRNWRSHGAIIAWSNRYLYEDMMRDHGNSYITYHLVNSGVLPKKGFPVIFHGVRGNQERTKSSPSYFNVLEASIIRNYCVKLINDPLNGRFVRITQILDLPYFSLTNRRSGGDWHSCALQNPGQGHPAVTEGGKYVRYFCGIHRAVPGTGLESTVNRRHRY